MKKKIITISSIVIFILIGIIILFHSDKFYIEDSSYVTGELKDITLDELNEKINNKDSFLLFTYNNYCSLKIPCNDIFESVAKSNNITIYSIKYEYFKDSIYHETVLFAPSVLIIKDGEIVSYLDSESDEDLNKYQDTTEFENWLDEFIYLEK